MKSLFIIVSFFTALNVQAAYKAEVLINWFTSGINEGVDLSGKPCKVIMSTSPMSNALYMNMTNLESHKIPRFNSYVSNELEEIKETATSLFIVLKSNPSNSYTSAVKQTLSAVKTPKGTEVTLTEKETRLFGKSNKATCIIK